MASPNAQSVDLPILTFGGMVTQYDPQTLPPGASPFNQDVAFSGVNPSGTGIVGGWASRPGMGTGFYALPFAGNPTVNYVKTFIDSTGTYHELTIDGLGVFRDESPAPTVPGTPNVIGQILAASFIQSDSLFNREFMAIGDGNYGIDIPRQWDGSYFDRVSQVGPGAGPTIVDGAAGNISMGLHQVSVCFVTREQYITKPSPPVSWTAAGSKKANLTNIPTGPPNIIARILIFTAVITAPAIAGDFFYFDGSVPTPTLGTFPSMVIQDNVTTTYTVDFTDAVLENTPVVTNLFNMLELGECAQVTSYSDRTFWVGERYKIPNFINLTFDGGFNVGAAGANAGPNSPSAAMNAGGGIWANPGNVFALDGVFATAVIPNGGISGNTTGQIIVIGFGFAIPASATINGIVARVYVKSSASGVQRISDTAVYITSGGIFTGSNHANGNTWGNSVAAQVYGGPADSWAGSLVTPAFVNAATFGISFGAIGNNSAIGQTAYIDYVSIQIYYSTVVTGSAPLGWTQGATFAGGGSALQNGLPAYWGDAYSITGDGATATRGLITQSAYQDYLGVSILSQNMNYRVRARVAQNGTLAAGNLHINLQSTIGGFTTTGLVVPFGSVGTTYVEFQAFLTDVPLTTINTDLLLQVYADGTPTNNASFIVDCIEIYPANQPFNRTLIRSSYAEQPEAFDALTGLLSINSGDGETVRLTFNILDNKLYIVKDRSMYSTQDDGQNEPSSWTINTVSGTVGTPSNRGVDVGESWAVIAHHDGPYIFWGSEPVKIGQEIQPTWDLINWQYGYTIYVKVDTHNKRIHIGAPINGATSPNVEFVCDYSMLANSEGATSAQDIVSHPQAYYSTYQPTKLVAPGKARKWTIWNISMNCAELCVRSDGSYHLLRGNGKGTGKVYDQLPTNLNDDGVAIPVMYQTSYFPQTEDEQVLQLGAHRKLDKYLTGYCYGSGVMNSFLFGPQDQLAQALSPLTLKNPAQWDWEKNLNFVGERASLMFTLSGVNSWIQMTKLCPTLQREMMTPVRGNT